MTNDTKDTTEKERLKKRTYDLIKYLYKNMPYYNQLKGTYAGMQMILNMMGLCASITELWSDRKPDSLGNFTENANFYRDDMLHSVRQRIEDWGYAEVKDYYLTSRFDIDVAKSKNITFELFNDISSVILTTVNQIKPITSCLNELKYILQCNASIHLEYLFRHECIGYAEDEMPEYRYNWIFEDFYRNSPRIGGAYDNKTTFDHRAGYLYSVFLPWTATTAESSIGTVDRNAYCILNRLDKIAEVQDKFTLDVTVTRLHHTHQIIKQFKLNEDIELTVEQNGILIKFISVTAQSLIVAILGGYNWRPSTEIIDIQFSIRFIKVPLGSGRIFQKSL